jgi:hypothetical protein
MAEKITYSNDWQSSMGSVIDSHLQNITKYSTNIN